MAYALRHQGQTATASGLDLIAGLWLLISPFVLAFSSMAGATSNNVIIGIIVALLAIYRLSSPVGSVWASWVNCLLGIWTIISPWLVGFATTRTPVMNNVITGICIIIFAFWSAAAGSMEMNEMRQDDQVRARM